MIINISKEYTKMPGGRTILEGEYSGEEFREKLLKPAYLETCRIGDNLTVVLDGGYGYATSFLEEAFGGLVRCIDDKKLLKGIERIKIVSEEEPAWVDKVSLYISDALKEKGVKVENE